MGWLQAIGSTAGQLGNDIGTAYDKNVNDALHIIQSKLMLSDLQNRITQQGIQIKQSQMPQPKGIIAVPGGGQAGVTFNPNTSSFETQPLVQGVDRATAKMRLADMAANSPAQFKPVFETLSGLVDSGLDPKEALIHGSSIQTQAAEKLTATGKEPVPVIHGNTLMALKDPLTNKTYTAADYATMPPEMQKSWDSYNKSLQDEEQRIENRETRRLAQQTQLQTQALQNFIQKGAIDEARKTVAPLRSSLNKLNDSVQQDEMRYELMKKVWQDVQKNPENIGSFDAALAAFHMGMTVGQVKGMRTGKDMVKFHVAARSLPEDMQVAFDHWMNGAELSPQQRQNFVELAEEKMQTDRQALANLRTQYNQGIQEYQNLVSGVTGGKTQFAGETNTAPKFQVGQTVNIKGRQLKVTKVYPDGTFDAE